MAVKRKKVVHLDPVAWERKVKRIRTIVICALACVAAFLSAFFLIKKVIIPTSDYKRAESALASGSTAEGIDAFSLLRGYKDAGRRAAEEAYAKCGSEYDYLKTAKVGEIVEFGHYEQDGSMMNGPEPIRWVVCTNENDALYLLSESLLDAGVYHSASTDVTWESCDLRAWLNSVFIDEAFTENERLLVAKTRIKSPSNPVSFVSGGADTEDKVFVPSFEEIMRIAGDFRDLGYDAAFYSYPTKQAVKNGVDTAYYGTASWWTRTPGINQSSVTLCDPKGEPIYSKRCNYEGVGVRPALWILTGESNG